MTIIWTLLALLALTKTSMPSIVGVTYQDHFDFEERYADPNECNPFYWHPLHLPERCAEIFEKAIRKRVAANGPMRLMINRPKLRSLTRQYHYTSYDNRVRQSYDVYVPNLPEEVETYKIDEILTSERQKTPLSPYDEMMELLRNDISYLPTAPKVAAMPGLGVVALYEQPISKQSASSIKKVAKLYAKASQQHVYQYPYPYPYVSEVILKYKDDGQSGTTDEQTTENSDADKNSNR